MSDVYSFTIDGVRVKLHYDKKFFLITFDTDHVDGVNIDKSEYIVDNNQHMPSYDQYSPEKRNVIRKYQMGKLLHLL